MRLFFIVYVVIHVCMLPYLNVIHVVLPSRPAALVCWLWINAQHNKDSQLVNCHWEFVLSVVVSCVVLHYSIRVAFSTRFLKVLFVCF